MFKHILVCIVLTLLILVTKPFFHTCVLGLLYGYDFIIQSLGIVLKNTFWAVLLKEFIAVFIFSIGIMAIISLVYWAIKRTKLPYQMAFLWGSWLIMMTALVGR